MIPSSLWGSACQYGLLPLLCVDFLSIFGQLWFHECKCPFSISLVSLVLYCTCIWENNAFWACLSHRYKALFDHFILCRLKWRKMIIESLASGQTRQLGCLAYLDYYIEAIYWPWLPWGRNVSNCLICRLVGVGEASFISLAAPFIIDNAPHDKVNLSTHSDIEQFCLYLLLCYYAVSNINVMWCRKQAGCHISICVFQLGWPWVIYMEEW